MPCSHGIDELCKYTQYQEKVCKYLITFDLAFLNR